MMAERRTQARNMRRRGPVGSIDPKQRLRPASYVRGMSPDDPIVCGLTDPDQSPQYVEADAMAFGLRHGEKRWVIGRGVAEALARGWFLPAEAPVKVVVEVTGPEMPVAQLPEKLHSSVMYCSDCTQTWPAEAKKAACECDPPDPDVWKMLSR